MASYPTISDDLFEQLLAVKEELFDAYARGEKSEAERENKLA